MVADRTGHIRETSGDVLASIRFAKSLRSETKVFFGGQTMVHAKVRFNETDFNETATPIEVDYLNLVGKGKGSISLGLFRCDGEEAVYCMGAPGEPRPSDFSCEPGSGRTFSRWSEKYSPEFTSRNRPKIPATQKPFLNG